MKRLATYISLALVIGSCSGLRLPNALKPGEHDWPMFGRTPMRTNAASDPVLPPLAVDWEYDISSGMGFGSPVVIDSILIASNMRGELYAININTGKRIGWVSIGDALHGSPAMDGNTAFLGVSNTRESLVAYNLFEGKFIWKREYGDIESTPLLVENSLYFGNTSGFFFSVDKSTGDQNWRYRLQQNTKRKGIRSAAALTDGLVVFGADDGSIYALDAATGSERWSHHTGAPIQAAVSVDNGVVFCGNLNGTLVALNAENGSLKWKFDGGTGMYAAASFADSVVLVGTTGGRLFGLHKETGKELWSVAFNSVINSSAVVSGNVAYVGTLMRHLYAVRVKDGTIAWQHTLKGRVKTSPAIAQGKVFIATDDRLILAFKPEERNN